MSVLNVSTYEPQPDDNFFFDTNIWVTLFEPIGNIRQNAQSAYSLFFQKILFSRSKVHISSLIVSEFINVLLRNDFNLWKNKQNNVYADFKRDYRKTERCKKKSGMIATTLTKRILPQCTRLNDKFDKIKPEFLLNDLSDSDFNDLYIIQLARNNNLKIVSGDRDLYSYSNIPVFSHSTE